MMSRRTALCRTSKFTSLLLNMGDSQAPFSLSVRNAIRETYGNRCVLCLLCLPPGGGQCVPLIDQSPSRGVRMKSKLYLVHKHIFLSFSTLSVWVSCLWILTGALWTMGCSVRAVLSAELQLTRQRSMPYVSFVLFHSRLHCLLPPRTLTSIHRRVPQRHTSG